MLVVSFFLLESFLPTFPSPLSIRAQVHQSGTCTVKSIAALSGEACTDARSVPSFFLFSPLPLLPKSSPFLSNAYAPNDRSC